MKKHNIPPHLLLTTVLLLFGLNQYAQVIQFDNYDIRDGLPSNVIVDIMQDSKGYMWFATQVGVSRYDGYRFVNYGIADGLPGNETECLFEDSKGQIWVGTLGGGVAVFSGNTWSYINKEDGLADNYIKAIFEDDYETVWCVSENGISGVSADTIVSFAADNELSGKIIISHCIDRNGTIFLGTENGLNCIKRNSLSGSFEIEHLLQDVIIHDLINDRGNNIWIATQGDGIYTYNGTTFIQYGSNQDLPASIVIRLLEDAEGNIWAGFYQHGIGRFKDGEFLVLDDDRLNQITVREWVEDSRQRIWVTSMDDDGLYIIQDGHVRKISTLNGLPDDLIWTFQEDANGNMWMGTNTGIAKQGKKPFEIYSSESGLPGKDVISVFAGSEGKIWGGTYNGPFVIEQNNTVSVYDETDGLPEDALMIFKILGDRYGRLWFGTFYGITLFSDGKFLNYYNEDWEKDGVNTNSIGSIAVDSQNKLILANEDGICTFYEGSYTYPEEYSYLKDHDIRAIALDNAENLWVCTSEGIYIHGMKILHITMDEGLSNNSCNDVFIDPSGNGWIATDNGLNKIGLSADWNYIVTDYFISDGLLSNSIMFVEGDHLENLWIGHENGLSRFIAENGQIVTYRAEDGFLALETYQKAASVDELNNVWIGTVDGLIRYNPEKDIPQNDPPRIHITSVDFYNDSSDIFAFASYTDSITGLPVHLVLPYNRNNLVFEFVGLHYANTTKNRYQYMLEGYDDSWSEITGNVTTYPSTHPYQKLPHGDYNFVVKAANCDGVWSEPVSFSFSIRPPFWKATWFYFIEIVVVVSLIYAFVKIRERKLQHDKKVLAEKVRERTIEVERQRDHIAGIHREITNSIMYAQRIQSAVLPEERTIKALLKDYFILFKPRDIVSGDFYWAYKKGKKIIVVAADCTGHGVPGAFMSMLGVSLLNEIVTSSDALTAADILNQLRINLKKTLSQTGKRDEAKDGMDLALCILEPANHRAQYAGAYNPLLLMSNNEMSIFPADKMPIGIHVIREKPFTNHIFNIKTGDVIYMFTDGYADQFGGPEKSKFKAVRFRELLLQIHRQPMDEQLKILDTTIENWKGDGAQIDDIMVMGIRIVLNDKVTSLG